MQFSCFPVDRNWHVIVYPLARVELGPPRERRGTCGRDAAEGMRCRATGPHEAFGAGLCEAWKFPKSFVYVTRHHHDPTELPVANRMLASIVYTADRIAAQCGFGFRGDLPDLMIEVDMVADLGLTQDHIDSVYNHLPQAYSDIEATFG